jgi:hypothetical protein
MMSLRLTLPVTVKPDSNSLSRGSLPVAATKLKTRLESNMNGRAGDPLGHRDGQLELHVYLEEFERAANHDATVCRPQPEAVAGGFGFELMSVASAMYGVQRLSDQTEMY